MTIVLETDYLRYVIGDDGRNVSFLDKETGVEYLRGETSSHIVSGSTKAGRVTPSHAALRGDVVELILGEAGTHVSLAYQCHEGYIILEVASVEGELEELSFPNLSLSYDAAKSGDFAACALALNLKTYVAELPGRNVAIQAKAFSRFGLAGAKAAIVACPGNRLRATLKEAVLACDEVPHSPLGGPQALDSEGNRGSYLFNFGDLSEETVDEWIRLAKSLGISQIDFHGGHSFRFGDFKPNPETYPKGIESMRAVTDRLHEAGILAGLHTYSFFLDKGCRYVTPKPDPRLAKDYTFTLAKTVGRGDSDIFVSEPTENVSTITGFFVRNSVTIQIDEELIKYSGVSKKPPYGFTGCERGAYGTRASPHREGAKVHHLKECFGLFVPDGESSLYREIAARTADTFNRAGFDMIYLDALDGEDVVGGAENGWHYGSKFVFEIWKHLERPAIMEMSTFHHHLWYVRSRMGAWDHPSRSHKRFIDVHCSANEACRRMFLPEHLGWWAFKTWAGPQVEPTFPDDIEYLCCKCIAHDAGLSVMGIDPEKIHDVPALGRLAEVMKRYEEVRRSGSVPKAIKDELAKPGAEFTLLAKGEGSWQFEPIRYFRHKIESTEPWSTEWKVENPFKGQIASVRMEVLNSSARYDADENITLVSFDEGFGGVETAGEFVEARLEPFVGPQGRAVASYSAKNASGKRSGTWTKAETIFSPPLDLEKRQALGLWVYGDGKGEVLNLQLKSPEHVSTAIGEHYIIIDFLGWRYFELIEPEGERYENYEWPYGSPYAIYREAVDYSQIESLSLWFNNLPPKESVRCLLSEIKAMPLEDIVVEDPTLMIGGRETIFPAKIPTGAYLEYQPASGCRVYGRRGEVLGEVDVSGSAPFLDKGRNMVGFSCCVGSTSTPRLRVSLSSKGEPFGGAEMSQRKS